MIKAIFGGSNPFGALHVTIHGSVITYGAVLNALLNFVIGVVELRDRGRGDLLPGDQAGQRADGQVGTDPDRGVHARMPGVPVQGAGPGDPLRLLHLDADDHRRLTGHDLCCLARFARFARCDGLRRPIA